MSKVSKRRRDGTKARIKGMGDHREFLKRITKTLYYGQLPSLACLSLPVTEISCELWSVSQRGRSLRRLHTDEAAHISRSACVSPCALVLAILYLKRLKSCNPDYLAATSPSDLFLVSLMVGNKFLQDDGEDDEVICSEWAASGGIDLKELKKLEVEFLNAIEWNVYVSSEAFSRCLCRLERAVALRVGGARGWFTYADVCAAAGGDTLAELSRAAAAAVALTLGYVSGLLALVTSTLVISQAWLPVLQYAAVSRTAVSTNHNEVITSNSNTELPYGNTTMDLSELTLAESLELSGERLGCCPDWSKYHETVIVTNKRWPDAVVVDESSVSWWSETSLLTWLYQTSLISPIQRWLDKLRDVEELLSREFPSSFPGGGCSGPCVWPNRSRPALAASDR